MQTLKPRVRIAPSAAIRIHRARAYRLKGRHLQKANALIKMRDKHLCQACLQQGRVTIGVEVDHIVPLYQGGGDDDSNKQLLCVPCHKAKTKRESSVA